MNRPRKYLPVPKWHGQFLSMLPTIKAHAAAAFKAWGPAREKRHMDEMERVS